jgi:hypothetical protein
MSLETLPTEELVNEYSRVSSEVKRVSQLLRDFPQPAIIMHGIPIPRAYIERYKTDLTIKRDLAIQLINSIDRLRNLPNPECGE